MLETKMSSATLHRRAAIGTEDTVSVRCARFMARAAAMSVVWMPDLPDQPAVDGPNSTPRLARWRSPGTLSSASAPGRRNRSRATRPAPFAEPVRPDRSGQFASNRSVRASCHTIAGATGSPVFASRPAWSRAGW